MYKFVAKINIKHPGEPQKKKTEELVFGTSNADLKGLNFTQGFYKILTERKENTNWINNFMDSGYQIQQRLAAYQKENCQIKYNHVLEEVK